MVIQERLAKAEEELGRLSSYSPNYEERFAAVQQLREELEVAKLREMAAPTVSPGSVLPFALA